MRVDFATKGHPSSPGGLEYCGNARFDAIPKGDHMAAMKPRTGDGPLEVVKEGRSIIMRVPLEGGGRLVVEISQDEIKQLQEALGSVKI